MLSRQSSRLSIVANRALISLILLALMAIPVPDPYTSMPTSLFCSDCLASFLHNQDNRRIYSGMALNQKLTNVYRLGDLYTFFQIKPAWSEAIQIFLNSELNLLKFII